MPSRKEIEKLLNECSDETVKVSVKELISIYKDDWQDIINDALSDQFEADTIKTLMPLTTQEMNLLKRVVNEVSLIYKKPAVREAVILSNVEGSDDIVDDNYQEAMSDSDIDIVMQSANKYTNLSNHVLIKPVYRDGKIDYDIITFDNCEIVTHPDDWKRIIAVKYYIGMKLNTGSGSSTNNQKVADKIASPYSGGYSDTYKEYTKAKLYTLEDVQVDNDGSTVRIQQGKIYTYKKVNGQELLIGEEDIPYRDVDGNVLLPFVLTSKSYPINSLLDFTTGNDLRDLNINVALLMTHQNALQKYQSYLQIWLKVQNIKNLPKKQAIGPAKILGIPVGDDDIGDVGVLDLQAKIKEHQEVIEKRITMALTNYGISPQNFTLSAAPQSGFSMQMSNIAKLEAREDQLPIYRNIEKKLFKITRSIWNYHNPGKKINEKARLKIDFAEVVFPQSPDEKEKEFAFLKRNNAKTDIDLIMENNPDLTRDDAIKEYAENKAFNQANTTGVTSEPAGQPIGAEDEDTEND